MPKLIGKGYAAFWRDKHRYRVVKGGRGSKKSTTMALWLIYHIMKHPLANALCVRKTGNTHKDSTFAELKKAAKRLGVYDNWIFNVSPLAATYRPTGQKILFRGFDDPLKLTSITVETGVLCWVWVEEAYEIDDEAQFDTLDESIRGEMPDGLWKQITLTFNPWVSSHWTKERFFDHTDPNAFTLTTTHKCNEFLDEADHARIEALAQSDPDRYLVVGLGEYGIPGGAYFSEFRRSIHTCGPFVIPNEWRRYVALDYGLDMLACYWIALDSTGRAFVYRELYKPGLLVSEAAREIRELTNEKIYAYYAPSDLWARHKDTGRSTAEIFALEGIPLTRAQNRRVQGWYELKEWLKPYKDEQGEMTASLVIFDCCKNLIRTLPQIQCDGKDSNDCASEPHELTHAPDAIRYFAAGRPRPAGAAIKAGRFEDSFNIQKEKNLLGKGEKTIVY